jgi:PAS domain S-box-containing protein
MEDTPGSTGGSDGAARDAERERLAGQWKLALDAARMGWWHYDPVTRIATWDDRYAEIFGVTGHERPNEEILRRLHPDDLPGVWSRVEAALDPADPKPYRAEYRILRDGGEVRWVEAHGLATFEGTGASRRAVSFVGTVADVTDRKRDEADLLRSTTLLRAISDTTGDAIFAKDREGRLTFANPATLALIGKPLEAVLGRTDAEFLNDPAAARAVMQNDRRVMESGVAVDIEEVVPMPDGEPRVWLSRKMPYRDAAGRVIGLLGLSRDITDAKRAQDELRAAKEAAEAASRAKDDLLAVVSHELRTPLNPVLALASFLQARTDLPAGLRADMETIRRNIEQEARIVDDLLNLTRLSRGKVILHHEAVDVHALMAAVAAQFAAESDAKGVRLRTELRAPAHHAWADPGRLQQALSNLVANAVKFTPRGGEITLRSANDAGGRGDRLRLEVVDSGVGIDPGLLPRLFTPFEQGEKSTTRRYGGLGLGLVIVKGIVDLHGGTVSAHSDGPGRGATVSIELDALRPPAEAASRAPVAAGAPAAGKRLLLVEDHPDTLAVMTRLLRGMGYSVLTAANAGDAIAKVRTEPFDLLLSDIGLPDGSGLDVMRALREHRGEQHARGVALSGFGHDDDVRRSREAGFAEHLIKPVNLARLDATLKALLA